MTSPTVLTHVDVCSGIGMNVIAAMAAGFTTVALCEIEDYPRHVLRYYHPEVPLYDASRREGSGKGVHTILEHDNTRSYHLFGHVSQSTVHLLMCGVAAYVKIGGLVVGLVAVNVVNDFFARQSPTRHLLGNEDVFIAISIDTSVHWRRHQNISGALLDASTPFPSGAIGARIGPCRKGRKSTRSAPALKTGIPQVFGANDGGNRLPLANSCFQLFHLFASWAISCHQRYLSMLYFRIIPLLVS